MSKYFYLVCLSKRIAALVWLCGFIACKGTDEKKKNAATLTANDGIFNSSQVAEGSELYNNNCAACHGRDLRGSEGGTALMGERFITKWKDQSLGALFTLTQNTMPKTNPKS